MVWISWLNGIVIFTRCIANVFISTDILYYNFIQHRKQLCWLAICIYIYIKHLNEKLYNGRDNCLFQSMLIFTIVYSSQRKHLCALHKQLTGVKLQWDYPIYIDTVVYK